MLGRPLRALDLKVGILLAILLAPLLLAGSVSSAFAEPQITLSPDQGEPGANVDVTGSGFGSSALMSITFDGATMNTRPIVVTADGQGNFEASFSVPHSAHVGTYEVEAKGHGLVTSSATASFQVTGDNTRPVADSQSVTTDMNEQTEISLRGSDSDGDEITFIIVDEPQRGNITEFDSADGSLIYVPDQGYSGKDRFTFKVNDGKQDSFLAEVSIKINESSSGPRMEDLAAEVEEDNEIVIYLTATDEDSPSLSFSVVTVPQHGSLGELKRLDSHSAYVTYTPSSNFNGTDSFTAKASDGRFESETATITISVTPVQDSPVANSLEMSTSQGGSLILTLSASDPDGDTLTYSIESQPAHGTLAGSAPELTYVASSDYQGWDGFTFKVNDGITDSNVARVDIMIQSATSDDDGDGSSGGGGNSGGSDNSGDSSTEPPPVTTPPEVPTEEPTTPPPAPTPEPVPDENTPIGELPTSEPDASGTDIVPPKLILPASNLIFDSQSDAGTAVTYNVAAIDDVDGEIVPECSPESGYTFPIGRVNVICNATDKSGNNAIGTFTVEVRLVEGEPAGSPLDNFMTPMLAVAIVSVAGVATYVGMRVKRVNARKSSPRTAG